MTSLLPFFTSPWFFVAGAVCALGPVIIHFLNRRRYVVVDWAAMDFLREALRRNRRILELRDVALLILRTLAVLLIGTALARPLALPGVEWAWLTGFFRAVGSDCRRRDLHRHLVETDARWFALGATAAFLALAAGITVTQLGAAPDIPGRPDGSQPIHAVVLLDNSLSMGYQSLSGTLLDAAKERAKDYLAKLPPEAGPRSFLCAARGGRSASRRIRRSTTPATRSIKSNSTKPSNT